jgi:peroxin-6
MATPEEIAVIVTAEDFAAALGELVPSVSQAEMANYAQIRERFSRSVNANDDADDQDLNINTAKGKGKGKGRDNGMRSSDGDQAEASR